MAYSTAVQESSPAAKTAAQVRFGGPAKAVLPSIAATRGPKTQSRIATDFSIGRCIIAACTDRREASRTSATGPGNDGIEVLV